MAAALIIEPCHGRREIALAGIGFDLAAAFDEHGSALLGFAINALQERQLAEDCVQETFLRAWRSREKFDPARSSLRTWLFAIERNIVIDALRARARTPKIAGTEHLDTVAVTGETDPLERIRLTEAIARLSEDHRAIVVAVHITGSTYAEVSAQTGVPAATLRTRAFHALRALRRDLEDGDRQ